MKENTYNRERAGEACAMAQLALGGDWWVRPMVDGTLQFWVGSHEKQFSMGIQLTGLNLTAEQAAAKIVQGLRLRVKV